MSENHKKIAFMSLPFEANYGGCIQSWALYYFLLKNGYEPTFLNRRWNIKETSLIRSLLRWGYLNVYLYPFMHFVKKNIRLSPVFRDSLSLKEYVERGGFEAVITGSDQVWRIENVRGADLNFFLDFLSGSKIKKISYAASFGSDKWKGEDGETKTISKLLQEYSLVSVREDSGVALCRENFGADAVSVLDPTMLLTSEAYRKVANVKSAMPSEVVTYILDNNKWKSGYISMISEKLGTSEIALYPKRMGRLNRFVSIEKWISSIANAKYVVVDSFHGMVFAILFNKPFTVIANVSRGLPRFTSLLSKLDLMDRLVFDGSDFDPYLAERPIDYTSVNKKIEILRKQSAELLISAIEK